MARIVMLAMNTVTRDARVLKQARSLRAAGHDVTVFGITDAEIRYPATLLDDGLIVNRIEWQSETYEIARGRFLLFATIAILVLALALLAALAAIPFIPWVRLGSVLPWPQIFVAAATVAAIAPAIWLAGRVSRHLAHLRNSYSLNPVRPTMKPVPKLVAMLKLSGPYLSASERFRRLIRDAQVEARTRGLANAAIAAAPDAVHCHDIHTLPAGVRVKRTTGCKLIYDAHEWYEGLPQADDALLAEYARLHHDLNGAVDGFVTVNDTFVRLYGDKYPGFRKGVAVRNATPLTPDPVYDGRLHAAAGLPSTQKILLYQGGYAPRRGLPGVVRAAAHLPPDWSVVMMGWGKLEAELRGIAKQVEASIADAEARAQSARAAELLALADDGDGEPLLPQLHAQVLEDFKSRVANGGGRSDGRGSDALARRVDRTTAAMAEFRALLGRVGSSLGAPAEEVEKIESDFRSQLLHDAMSAVGREISRRAGGRESDGEGARADVLAEALQEMRDRLASLRDTRDLLAEFGQTEAFALAPKPPRIAFVPPAPHEDLVDWTAGATIGVIPYENLGLNQWYCSPNKLWEYPSACVPVLVSALPELIAQVRKYDIGWIIPGDGGEQAIGRLVSALSAEEIEIKRAATRRYKVVENWSLYEARLFELYRSLDV
jgi:glycosyltransferase involved in cell wall biosynthesis